MANIVQNRRRLGDEHVASYRIDGNCMANVVQNRGRLGVSMLPPTELTLTDGCTMPARELSVAVVLSRTVAGYWRC